jgi:Holliday junction resolvasome RuvABC DNA-binding subunit
VEAVKNVLKKPLSFLARTLRSDSDDSGETERKLCQQQDINALVDMGYNREVAAWALMENNHVLPLAVEALMRSDQANTRPSR